MQRNFEMSTVLHTKRQRTAHAHAHQHATCRNAPATRSWAAAAAGQPPAHHGSSPALYLAALTVLLSTAAMVMGPTPPGTGVMAPATCVQGRDALEKAI